MSLYEAWCVQASRDPGGLALVDHGTGTAWSYDALQQTLRKLPQAAGPVRAEGRGAGFILSTLQAWRDCQPLVPQEAGCDPVPLPQGIPEGICHIKTTSGSTGAARLVAFTSSQIAADARQIVATMGLSPSHPNLGVISLAHSYGFSNLVLPLLLHGMPLHLLPSPFPDALKKVLGSGDAFALPAVPALWRSWEDAGVDFSSVSLAISAGAPLALELERRVFERTGLKVHNFYGASECGGIAFDSSRVPRGDEAMAGTALSGVSLKVLEDGRLEIRSEAVGSGYLGERGDPDFGEGRFVVGDFAQLDECDSVPVLRLLGRSGELIHVAGRKVAPARIEDAVQRQPGVRHCLVFGAPSADPQRGETVVAAVSLFPGASLEEIRRGVASMLRDWERPRRWWECQDLAPDARGKLLRARWRERFLADPAAPSER